MSNHSIGNSTFDIHSPLKLTSHAIRIPGLERSEGTQYDIRNPALSAVEGTQYENNRGLYRIIDTGPELVQIHYVTAA